MRKKLVWLSDFSMEGSGYLNISTAICSGLSDEYDIKAVGMGYQGQEHNFPFSIIPAQNLQEGMMVLQNLVNLWGIEALVVALDIPLQIEILRAMQQGRSFKYIGFMPVEADPLCMSWAMGLLQMDKVFIISEFGTNEAKKVGVNAEHLQIGIDTNAWRTPTIEEKRLLRKNLFGIEDDNTFVVLTVADNQERKHLSRAMEIFKEFSEENPNSLQVFVTRKDFPLGWKLDDYAIELGIIDKFSVFNRGLNFRELWSIYAASDMFLLTSKAEGLGLPLLEAMAVGLPCAGTDCTSISELLGDGRGWKIEPSCRYRDPFGNGARYFADTMLGVDALMDIHNNEDMRKLVIEKSRKYVETRKWEITVDQMKKALEVATNEQTK